MFISYSRRDTDFVRGLCDRLAGVDREVWVDWEDIPATADWSEEIRLAIESAEAFVFVISPDSVRSRVCGQELDHAVEMNKRLVPLLHRPTPDDDVPEAVSSLNWIFFRAEDDVEASMQRLVGALDTDLEWVRAHTRLLVRAMEWQAKDQDRSLLLRGAELAEAEVQVAAKIDRDPKQTSDQAQYLLTSRQAATRRQRGAVTSAVVVLVVVALLASLAWWQRGVAVDQRDTAQVRQLVASSRERLAADPELSLLLARRAYDLKPLPDAEVALRQAVADSRVRATLRANDEDVFDAAFSPDGRLVATAGKDGFVRVWDWAVGRELGPPVGRHDPGGVASVAFTPDGSKLVSAGGDGFVRVWDWAARSQVAPLDDMGPITRLAVSPADGRAIAFGREDGTVTVWDWTAPDGAGSKVDLPAHSTPVVAVAFSPDGTKVVSGAAKDKVAKVWDWKQGKQIAALPDHVGAAGASAVAFSPDGSRVATGGLEYVRVWELDGSETPRRSLRSHTTSVNGVAFSPDGQSVLSAGTDGAVKIQAWELDVDPIALLRGHVGVVRRASFSADGRLVVTSGQDGTARVWQWAGAPDAVALSGHTNSVGRAAVSPDARWVVSAGLDGLRTWDLDTGGPGPELNGSIGAVLDAAFSPDGRQVAAGGQDRVVRIWDWPTGRLLAPLPHQGFVVDVAFSPDGTKVLTTDTGALRVWDWADHEVLSTLPIPGAFSVSFSPDGRFVAAGTNEGRVLVADLQATGDAPREVKGHAGAVWQVAFSPDGQWIVSASQDQTVALWEWQRPGRPRVLSGHRDEVLYAAFSADGNRLVSASLDGTVRVWDWRRGRTLVELRSHAGGVRFAAFLSGTDRLITAGDDQTVRIATCEACRPIAEVRRLAAERSTRELTDDEKAAFLGEDRAAPAGPSPPR